ncbi:MAG: peptidylprolyl isomerase [Sulfolobus sp.]|nr:peptidylprolyl isomerase [Sulfolobus sp.]
MFKDNDFLYISYVAMFKDTKEVIDTNIEEEAKKANLYSPDKKYEPQLVILGEHRVIKGLEEALYNMNLSEEKEIEIPPDKAYGERDPAKVKIVSLGELRRQGISPHVNDVIRLADGNYATVKSISGGRVILDLNHPWAGKVLLYKVKVIKVLQDEKEKIKALMDRWFGENLSNKIVFELSEDKKALKFTIPKDMYLVDDIQIRKYMCAKDIISYVLPEAIITYIEEYNKATFSSQ